MGVNSNKEKIGNNRIGLEVKAGLSVNECYEFLMTIKEVAAWYGVGVKTIRKHRTEHVSELFKGKHYLVAATNSSRDLNNSDLELSHSAFLWTKSVIVRLWIFIKSERSRMFRDWDEDLIIHLDQQCDLFGGVALQAALTPKRHRNFTTHDRLLDIMGDVFLIEDMDLGVRLSDKEVKRCQR